MEEFEFWQQFVAQNDGDEDKALRARLPPHRLLPVRLQRLLRVAPKLRPPPQSTQLEKKVKLPKPSGAAPPTPHDAAAAPPTPSDASGADATAPPSPVDAAAPPDAVPPPGVVELPDGAASTPQSKFTQDLAFKAPQGTLLAQVSELIQQRRLPPRSSMMINGREKMREQRLMLAIDQKDVTADDIYQELRLAVHQRLRVDLRYLGVDLRAYYAPSGMAFAECFGHKVKTFVQNTASLFQAEKPGSLDWAGMYEVALQLVRRRRRLRRLRRLHRLHRAWLHR